MKILYFGPMWRGSTTVQRCRAMASLPGSDTVQVDSSENVIGRKGFLERVRWKLGWPVDTCGENERLLSAVHTHRPDIVLVEGSKVIERATLQRIRAVSDPVLAYYTPDNIIKRHNCSRQLRSTFSQWDVLFTTKRHIVSQLATAGVKSPVLIGNAFDEELHRPYTEGEIGEDFERFDCVFMGEYEKERAQSVAALGKAGLSVLVAGNRRWEQLAECPGVVLSAHAYAESYAKTMHLGKVALCFLRKINDDEITTRSIEIPAMGRPMVAEKTDEHDAHFVDGKEYLGFSSDAELVEKVRRAVADSDLRNQIGEAGRLRCLASGYSTEHRAAEMLAVLTKALETRRADRANGATSSPLASRVGHA